MLITLLIGSLMVVGNMAIQISVVSFVIRLLLSKASERPTPLGWAGQTRVLGFVVLLLFPGEIPGDLPMGADKLARRIKAVRLTLTGVQGLDRAISSAGGVKGKVTSSSAMASSAAARPMIGPARSAPTSRASLRTAGPAWTLAPAVGGS